MSLEDGSWGFDCRVFILFVEMDAPASLVEELGVSRIKATCSLRSNDWSTARSGVLQSILIEGVVSPDESLFVGGSRPIIGISLEHRH